MPLKWATCLASRCRARKVQMIDLPKLLQSDKLFRLNYAVEIVSTQ